MSFTLTPPFQANGIPIVIQRIRSYIFKAPVQKPVVSTLTTVTTRVALLIQIEDQDGCFGWGEIYATLPSFSADHKINILHQIIFPLIKNHKFYSPVEMWEFLEKNTRAMQIQTGEFGPFSCVIAGLDCALWDLLARKNNLSLTEFLGGHVHPLPAYASGLNPADGPQVVEHSRHLGFNAFKQKIGFGSKVDEKNLLAICAMLKDHERLMVDVNQGWSIEQLRSNAQLLNTFPLYWIEEPLLANANEADWLEAKQLLKAPLAGGENLRGSDFEQQSKWLTVLQPDVGKWGGISGNWSIAKYALTNQLSYCPHWLGSGIGLLTSAHLLAAIGGDGMLEMDVNENPLREILAQPFPQLKNGYLHLTQHVGIGVEPHLPSAKPWITHYQESTQ